jgi:hypothetical protein
VTNVQENPGAQRTRRNTMKMGAILAFAALGSVSKTDPASANCGNNGKLVGNGCAKGNATNCFLKGTTIRTVSGDRKIEDLAIGELLPTMFGGLRPIQWIGRYPIKRSDPSKPWVKDALPVRSRSQCPPCRSLCDEGTLPVDRWRIGAGGGADQRHDHHPL